jgi:hypothetical protein
MLICTFQVGYTYPTNGSKHMNRGERKRGECERKRKNGEDKGNGMEKGKTNPIKGK